MKTPLIMAKRERGYIVIFLALSLVIMTFLAVDLTDSSLSAQRAKYRDTDADLERLEAAKQQLLAFTALTPVIYATNADGTLTDNDKIPGPGYFPCPDINQDGAQEPDCGGTATAPYVAGQLPIKNATRNFTFDPLAISDNTIIQYTVSDPFVYQSNRYNTTENPSIYTPLNSTTVNTLPTLSINGQSGFVVVLLLPGQDGTIAATNQNTTSFTTVNNDDLILGITTAEWQTAAQTSACYLKTHPPRNLPEWYDSSNPPVGSGWQGVCP